MKIKTAKQYQARYERRGAARRVSDLRRSRDYISTVVERSVHRRFAGEMDPTWGNQPDHKARTASLEECWFPSRVAKSKGMPHSNQGLTVIGGFQGCAHVLSVWHEDVDDKGKPVYFQRAMPCTVNHGWKTSRFGDKLIPDMGSPGTHIDKLGRVW